MDVDEEKYLDELKQVEACVPTIIHPLVVTITFLGLLLLPAKLLRGALCKTAEHLLSIKLNWAWFCRPASSLSHSLLMALDSSC